MRSRLQKEIHYPSAFSSSSSPERFTQRPVPWPLPFHLSRETVRFWFSVSFVTSVFKTHVDYVSFRLLWLYSNSFTVIITWNCHLSLASLYLTQTLRMVSVSCHKVICTSAIFDSHQHLPLSTTQYTLNCIVARTFVQPGKTVTAFNTRINYNPVETGTGNPSSYRCRSEANSYTAWNAGNFVVLK
jgi:hypothetical protein